MTPSSPLNNVQSIIAISSCKGGVGKSTIAAQLAAELAQRGSKVGLVDTDLFGPSIPTLFNINHSTVYKNEQGQLLPIEKNNLKIMSFGFLLGEGPAVMRGPMVTNYVHQILHNTVWGDLDYLIVDMPPGTGDIQLTITQSVNLSGAVIVTTPQTLSLIDVARGILMFEKVDVPILGLIENMSYFICDQCDKKHAVFGSSSSQKLQDRFGIEPIVELPLTEQMTQSIDESKLNPKIAEAVDKIIDVLKNAPVIQAQVPEIRFDRKMVQLKWEDGTEISVNNRDLRLSCQCALCVNEMTGEKTLKEESISKDVAPTAIVPLGNYAISVTWTDRHSSGIYPYKNIKELGKLVKH